MLLGSYLNDHLAGATAGVALMRRAAGTARGTPTGEQLDRLLVEVEQDRDALRAMMAGLGVPVRAYKLAGGWALERVGRLKPNGRLLSRSPLSDLVELEALRLGVAGKAAGWRALRTVADRHRALDAAQLDRLVDRAERQEDVLEGLRVQAARRSLG